jgi:alanine racemase
LADAGCQHFFVANLNEAVELRPHLSRDCAIYVLNGLQKETEPVFAAAEVSPVLNSLEEIRRWLSFGIKFGQQLPAAVQIDTGMSRFGLSSDEVTALVSQPDLIKNLNIRVLMSHLACADECDAVANNEQYNAFAGMARHFPDTPMSLDNSSGCHLRRGHFDIVRVGIGLLGSSPPVNPTILLKPVASLQTRIAQVRCIPAGACVGYGGTFRAEKPTYVATIPVGYADGWPRRLGNRGAAFIGDERVPIVGRISMDSMTLDVSAIPEQRRRPNTVVELIGKNQTIDQVAADAETIPYEIFTQLGSRYQRYYV